MEKRIHSPESLGQAVRDERKRRGVNQATAGAAVGLDQTTVSAIERGNPGTRLDTLFRMLAALDLELVIRERQGDSAATRGDRW